MDLFQLYVTLFFFTFGILVFLFFGSNGIWAYTGPRIHMYVNVCMFTNNIFKTTNKRVNKVYDAVGTYVHVHGISWVVLMQS